MLARTNVNVMMNAGISVGSRIIRGVGARGSPLVTSRAEHHYLQPTQSYRVLVLREALPEMTVDCDITIAEESVPEDVEDINYPEELVEIL